MAEMIKKFTMRRWNGTDWDQLYPKTSAEIVVFDNAYTGSHLTDTDVQSALETIDLSIGDLTTLNTDAQTDLVSAINEVWQTVDDQVLSWTVKADTGEVTVSTDEVVQYLGDAIISTEVTKDEQTGTTTVQFSHAETEEDSIEGLTDGDVISDIVIDEFGHIVGLNTRTLVADDIMSNYVDEAEDALTIDGALLDIDSRLDSIEDNLLIDGFLDAEENTYNPYAAKTGDTDFVHFYYGTTNPDATAPRLNLNANLHAAKFNDLKLTQSQYGFAIEGGSTNSNKIVFNDSVSFQGDLTINSWTDKEFRVFSNLIVGDTTNHTATFTLLADAAAARTLKLGPNATANHVAFFNANGALTSEAQLNTTRGGTGIGSYAKGDILYSDATDSLTKRAIGSTNNVLVVSSDGVPVWTNNLNVNNIDANDITMTGRLRGPAEFYIDASPDGKEGTVIIEGDLVVRGDTTTVNSQNVTIKDAFILLNSDMDADGEGFTIPVVDAGIEIERYDQTNVKLFWDESDNEWAVTDGTTLNSQDNEDQYSQFTLMHTGNFTIPMINSPITNYDGPVYVGAMVYEVIETVAV